MSEPELHERASDAELAAELEEVYRRPECEDSFVLELVRRFRALSAEKAVLEAAARAFLELYDDCDMRPEGDCRVLAGLFRSALAGDPARGTQPEAGPPVSL